MISIEQHLINQKYEFDKLASGVWIVYNFFTHKDFEPIWALINGASQEDWETSYRNKQKLLALKKFNRTDIDNLIQEGLMEYTYSWVDKNIDITEEVGFFVNRKLQKLFATFKDNLHISNFEGVQRQPPGVELKEHVDGDAHPQIEYAIIAYMNDDYNGGELFFSKLGIQTVPPKNSLLIFSNGLEYLHGVKKVLDGPTRYVLPTFLYHYI